MEKLEITRKHVEDYHDQQQHENMLKQEKRKLKEEDMQNL